MLQKSSTQPLKPQKPKHSRIKAAEWKRLLALTEYERDALQHGYRVIAGLDEAGRGPLAGPVVAAACVIPEDRYIIGIDDSKKLTAEKRHAIFDEIKSDGSIKFSIGIVSPEEIDRINIYQASLAAMLQALEQLSVVPDMLLVDGMHLDYSSIPCKKIIKGDQLSQSIAAASIIAKETRDKMMREYHLKWPHYGFDKHKGYGTAGHIEAIAKYGQCPIHRLTFRNKKKS